MLDRNPNQMSIDELKKAIFRALKLARASIGEHRILMQEMERRVANDPALREDLHIVRAQKSSTAQWLGLTLEQYEELEAKIMTPPADPQE